MNSNMNSQKKTQFKSIESLHPNSKNFDFNLWSMEVRHQMVDVLQKRIGKKSEAS